MEWRRSRPTNCNVLEQEVIIQTWWTGTAKPQPKPKPKPLDLAPMVQKPTVADYGNSIGKPQPTAYGNNEKPVQPKPTLAVSAAPVLQKEPPLQKEAPALQKEPPLKNEAPVKITNDNNTYEVTGTAVTTAHTLRLQGLEVKGGEMEFTGDASGVFTASASPLKRARLRTKDLEALRSRGTRFYFDFRPTRFEVRFYDANTPDTPLGVLYADAVPPAGNPGFGEGNWSTSF